jgi:hypothetical protein
LADSTEKLVLDRRYLLIALLPALVFLVNQLMLKYYADPWDILPERVVEFQAYREGAARIGMLAAFMLFFGVALAGLLFFAVSLRIFERKARGRMIVGFLTLAAAAMIASALVRGRAAEDYSGLSLFCLAAGYDARQAVAARAAESDELARARRSTGQVAVQPPPPGVAVKHLPRHSDCPYPRFSRMRDLAAWQFRAVCLAFAALVFGGIFCLSGRPRAESKEMEEEQSLPPGALAAAPASLIGRAPAEADIRLWERQSEWLNACLYLSALLLASALLFINAFLQWPDFVLTDARDRDAYVAAMVSYYGVTFSVMLASFYIPVAVILATRVKAAGGKLPEAFKGPRQLVKIVLGLSSTALAGVLPGILELVG